MGTQHPFNLVTKADILAEKIRKEPNFVREYLLQKTDETPDQHEYHYFTAIHYAAARYPESFKLLLEFVPDLVECVLLDRDLQERSLNESTCFSDESIEHLAAYLPHVWTALKAYWQSKQNEDKSHINSDG